MLKSQYLLFAFEFVHNVGLPGPSRGSSMSTWSLCPCFPPTTSSRAKPTEVGTSPPYPTKHHGHRWNSLQSSLEGATTSHNCIDHLSIVCNDTENTTSLPLVVDKFKNTHTTQLPKPQHLVYPTLQTP